MTTEAGFNEEVAKARASAAAKKYMEKLAAEKGRLFAALVVTASTIYLFGYAVVQGGHPLYQVQGMAQSMLRELAEAAGVDYDALVEAASDYNNIFEEHLGPLPRVAPQQEIVIVVDDTAAFAGEGAQA